MFAGSHTLSQLPLLLSMKRFLPFAAATALLTAPACQPQTDALGTAAMARSRPASAVASPTAAVLTTLDVNQPSSGGMHANAPAVAMINPP